MASASKLSILSPLIIFLTATSTILLDFVLGISGQTIILDGICLGLQFVLIFFLILSSSSFENIHPDASFIKRIILISS